MAALIYLFFIAAVFYWQIKSVKVGKNTKRKAIILNAVCSIAPVILYGIVFIFLIGIEELMGSAIIGEAYARLLIFVIAGGLVVTLVSSVVFIITTMVMKIDDLNKL
jgi:hypothetical protein